VEVHLLGGFAVRAAGRDVEDQAWRLRRARTLIKLLALAPERRLHRELLVELMWPDESPGSGSFHQVVYTARRALGEAGSCVAMQDGVVTLAGDVWVDVDAFEAQAAEARVLRTVAAYRAALGLYAGELLPEDRYEEWAQNRRAALHETQLALRVELAALQAADGDRTGAVETLQRTVVEDPLHEAAHRELMRLFASDGRGQQALAQYQQLRDALRAELGADPDPLTRELYREILAGQHDAARASGLPRRLTTFVGRERELTELERLLTGRARLITLTGPGGCGKTRLALELAERSEEDFELGARLVELAPIRDPALVVGETARALGVPLRSGEDPVAAIASQIGDAAVLLVLDNCEHLVDAAAALADALLRACANARIVATSRERLRIGGERAWRVPPLSLPAAGAAESEAVRLFCERAAEASRTFALTADNAGAVAEICRRLDGMPLALELAAARADVLSAAQIADRLGDALALLRAESRTALTRQQSLRATLEWSHDLLSDRERLLYRRLGVFAGSFTIEAVEGICGGDLDALTRLADQSLVHVEAGPAGHRYRMLDTISQHARVQLDASGTSVWPRPPIATATRRWRRPGRPTASRPSTTTCGPRSRRRSAPTRRSRCASARRCGGSGWRAVTSPRRPGGSTTRWPPRPRRRPSGCARCSPLPGSPCGCGPAASSGSSRSAARRSTSRARAATAAPSRRRSSDRACSRWARSDSRWPTARSPRRSRSRSRSATSRWRRRSCTRRGC
jgi:predicted ATPase/DNA-binding SARP family transcriptional activator